MKFALACVAAAAVILPVSAAQAAEPGDAIADLISQVATKVEAQVASKVEPILETFGLKASLYHAGRGMNARDSLGCKVVAMRTAAVDGVDVPRHTLLFIKETVGLPMPDGRLHDGYWYATDIGGGIHKGRIDLFTGDGAGSMRPMMPLNLKALTVSKVGQFTGCPIA